MRSILDKSCLPVIRSVRINVSVPNELHKQFKLKAVMNGESHQDIIIRAIQEYVDGK